MLLAAGCAVVMGCAARPAGHGLPLIYHYNTARISAVRFSDDMRREFVAGYGAAQKRGLENAWCLYGRRIADTLVVDSIAPAEVAVRADTMVRFASGARLGCRRSQGYVGNAHTHLAINGRPTLAVGSPADMAAFWYDTRAVLILVGVGQRPQDRALIVYWCLRDGRWGFLTWYDA